jgi:hypothetical protein
MCNQHGRTGGSAPRLYVDSGIVRILDRNVSPYVNELRRCLILSDNTKKRRAALAGEPHHYACAQADGQTTVGRSRRGAVPNASLSRVRRIAPLK